MAVIRHHVNLQAFNTFGIPAQALHYAELNEEAAFADIMQTDEYRLFPRLIIGGGSNILFTRDFAGLVIRNCLKGISLISENEETVLVEAASGENWHQFVQWCIAQGFGGLENLSLIPGCVGASPMQNIGAYGVEIKDVFKSLTAVDLENGKKRVFSKEECAFGYRESVFKTIYKNKYLITSVTFELKRHPVINISYGAIAEQLKAMGVLNPGISDVSKAVMTIRQSKLPDPLVTGNAGSFFKNPEVSAEKYAEILSQFPELVSYPLASGHYKLAAGWLIEQAGLKGYEKNGAAVHTRQALVLINTGTATGEAVLALSTEIIEKVKNKYGVTLEREVNII
jgi:UDP-N-acetylmuramate dehydrogenase